ncbi:MAG: hypothetical protein L6R45_05260 [Anaerolineae bacterium]|nr:hypothetical protein [Anaerolineae bacterium]
MQITDGVVVNAFEDGIHEPAIATIAGKPTIDSPVALEQARTAIPDFEPGTGKGRGYHFILQTDEGGKPILSVVGASKQTPAVAVLDPETGQVSKTQRYTLAQLGGILYSTDAGSTWQASNLTARMVNAVAKDLTKPGIAYAVAPQEKTLLLYRTEDGGQNWTAKGELPSEAGNWAYNLAVASNLNGNTYLLVGTASGLWSSTDEGNQWIQATSLPSGPLQWLAVIQDDKIVKIFSSVTAGPNVGLYSSTDLASWTKEAEGIFRLSESFDYKAVAATDENQDQALLIGGENRSTLKVPFGTLRLAGDFAGTGSLVLDGTEDGRKLTGDKNSDNPTWEKTLPESLASLAASPDLPNSPVFLAGGFRTGLFRSSDGGNNWENVLPDPSSKVAGSNELYSILFLSNEQVIAINGGEFSWGGF